MEEIYDVTPRDLLFTTIVEIAEQVEMAGREPSTMVPTLSLVVWRERLRKVLNNAYNEVDICAHLGHDPDLDYPDVCGRCEQRIG